jgi:hypothetical protein
MSDNPADLGPPNLDGSADRAEGLEAQLEEMRADRSRERQRRYLADASAPSMWRAWLLLGLGAVGIGLAVALGLAARVVTGMMVLLALQGLMFTMWGAVTVVKARDQRCRGAAGRRRVRSASDPGRFWEEGEGERDSQ